MNPIKNPFCPGAGTQPPELVGRESILNRANILFQRLKLSRAEKSLLLIGLRGTGKTVLLNEIDRLAKSLGCVCVFIEAHEKKPLAKLLLPLLRQLLLQLDQSKKISEKVKRGLRILKSFMEAIKLKYNDIRPLA